ncbi:MAG: SLBB domain-containing protein, partial [Elusimicrobiota bacterium]
EVKNNDTYILISEKTTKKVKVLGAVERPGFYYPPVNANIFDMIQLAGGSVEDADLTRVRHVTYSEGKVIENIVNVQKYLDEVGSTEEIPVVNEGDIIIIRKNVFTWKLFMSVLRDATIILSAYLLFQSVNKNP